jgi:4-hydroxybenzoate polyprenyltransferase
VSNDRSPVRAPRRAWEWLLTADRFVRIHFLSFSALWPLLGATSVSPRITAGELFALLGVTFCFHLYTMLLNDVIDLPIDRTQPKRQQDPLVRGTIQPWQVLAIALVQPLLTVPMTIWLGGTLRAHVTLAGGFVLMGAYNLWGKRCRFPPLTDAIQGLAWASLAIYAAQALGAAPNALTWMVAAYIAGFTLLFNGVHGSLRDLGNDFASGARTTAIVLGARIDARRGVPQVPRALAVYASCVLIGLIAIQAAVLFRNDFGYGPVVWAGTALAVGALNVLIVLLHPKVVHPRGSDWESAFRLHLFVVMMGLPAAFVPYAGANVLFTLIVLNALALVFFGSTPAIAAWAWSSMRAGMRLPQRKAFVTGIPGPD